MESFQNSNYGFDKDGNPKVHGSSFHAEKIQRVANRLREIGHRDIRIDQRQVDSKGNVVGNNRPDISFINKKTGERVNIEYDNRMSSRKNHEKSVNTNDSKSVNVFASLRSDGSVIKGTTKRSPESTPVNSPRKQSANAQSPQPEQKQSNLSRATSANVQPPQPPRTTPYRSR